MGKPGPIQKPADDLETALGLGEGDTTDIEGLLAQPGGPIVPEDEDGVVTAINEGGISTPDLDESVAAIGACVEERMGALSEVGGGTPAEDDGVLVCEEDEAELPPSNGTTPLNLDTEELPGSEKLTTKPTNVIGGGTQDNFGSFTTDFFRQGDEESEAALAAAKKRKEERELFGE